MFSLVSVFHPIQFRASALALGAAALLSSASARATPRALPFTYPPQTLPAGALELEQYVDTTPVRVAREDTADTKAVTSLRWDMQTEFEYGLTDYVELAWYFVYQQGASAQAPALTFRGVKQRVRFNLADRGVWPVDVGGYLEVAEYHNELEFEEKLLLGKRFGRLDVLANLWIEQEYYFQEDSWKLVYNPTVGASYELSPNFNAGLEYWARGRFDEGAAADETPSGARHYLGPALMAQRGEHFLTVGAYARLDRFGETQRIDDAWGNVWVRVLLGIGL